LKYTQNEKILQVTEKTLVVGVDIAKERHVGRAFDFRGVELGKRIEFENRKEGMEKFLDWANKIMKANGKENVMRLVKNFVFPIYNANCRVGLCC